MSPTSYQTAPPRGEVGKAYRTITPTHETNSLRAAPPHGALRNTLQGVALFRRKKNQLTDPASTPYVKMPRPVSAVANVTIQRPAGDPTIDALVAKLPYSNGAVIAPDPAVTIADTAAEVIAAPTETKIDSSIVIEETTESIDQQIVDGTIVEVSAEQSVAVETLDTPSNPAHLPDLYLTPKLERALIALAVHTQQISERLDRVETRLDNATKVDPDVATKAEVLAVRRHSAQIAAELALLSVELRSEIERAVTPAQDSATFR